MLQVTVCQILSSVRIDLFQIPVYDMPKDIDVIVDPLLDIVDVFGIKYDYPGQCAQFVCRAMCLNFRNKQFWIFGKFAV